MCDGIMQIDGRKRAYMLLRVEASLDLADWKLTKGVETQANTENRHKLEYSN